MRRALFLLFCLSLARGEDKLVTLTVTATDADSSNAVQDLRAADFQVTVDGRPRQVVFSRFEGGKTAHSATLLLLDLLNDRALSGQEIIDTAIDAVRGLETGEELYLYVLSARGQLVPIHAAPGLDSDAPPDRGWPRNVEPLLRDAFKNVFSLRSRGDSDVVTRLSITSQAILELAHALKVIPGRKNLIWVSHGVPLCGSTHQDDELAELTFRLRRVCEELQQSRIVVYPVMQSARGAAGTGGLDNQLEVEEIADLTGGRKYGSSYVREAVRQATADSRASYRLVYSSPEIKPDSKYHKIRVSAVRPGVRVSSKGGFYTVSPLSEPAQALRNRLELSSRSPFDNSTIRVRGTVSRQPASPLSIRVDLRVDLEDIFLRENQDLRTGQVTIWFTGFDAKGWNEPASTGPVDVRLNNRQYELAKRNGLEFQQLIRVNPGARKIRALVVDRELGSIGTLTLDLDR